MSDHAICLIVKANETVFEPLQLKPVLQQPPAGHGHNHAVPTSIIGYWIDIKDCTGRVVYRRFLHHLPLNLASTWQEWSNRKRKKANFLIELPLLENACQLELFEQKLESRLAKLPTRQCHFSLYLKNSEYTQDYCQSA